jgi:hypothetical protein
MSRKLDCPLPKFYAWMHRGIISPDITTGRTFLFDLERVEELKRRIEALNHQPDEVAA